MNVSKEVEKIKLRVGNGYPDGVDQESFKHIPLLLKRIEQLERTLTPFAKLATIEANLSNETTPCYIADCQRALLLLTEKDKIEPVTPIYPA